MSSSQHDSALEDAPLRDRLRSASASSSGTSSPSARSTASAPAVLTPSRRRRSSHRRRGGGRRNDEVEEHSISEGESGTEESSDEKEEKRPLARGQRRAAAAAAAAAVPQRSIPSPSSTSASFHFTSSPPARSYRCSCSSLRFLLLPFYWLLSFLRFVLPRPRHLPAVLLLAVVATLAWINREKVTVKLLVDEWEMPLAYWTVVCFFAGALLPFLFYHARLSALQRAFAQESAAHLRLRQMASQILVPYPLDQLVSYTGVDPERLREVVYRPHPMQVQPTSR